MSRFDCTADVGEGLAKVRVVAQNTTAMGDAIEALERHTATLSDLCRDRLADITRLDERVRNIAADLSRVEQRAGELPRRSGLDSGHYVVRPDPYSSYRIAQWSGVSWLLNTGAGGWESMKKPPHWIGPRVDMREG